MGTGRGVGRHQGEIIHVMKKAAGGNVSNILGEDPGVRAQMGFLWEKVAGLVFLGVPHVIALEMAWKEYLAVTEQPGVPQRADIMVQIPLICNEIMQTPDGFDPHNKVMESYKLTWITMRKWEEDPEQYFGHWLAAEAGYLHCWNQQDWVIKEGMQTYTVRFFIMWINGNYTHKPGKGPQATFTDVTWTKEELEKNWWQGIITYRDYLDKQAMDQKMKKGEMNAS